MKNIILTGFMASGKTTIGAELAKMMGFSFADTDAMIEKAQGRTIKEIFASDGEEYFRCLETQTAERTASMNGAVISTGGGMVLRTENMEHLRKNGVIFYLDTDIEVILARLRNAAASRPLASGVSEEDIRARFEARRSFYENCDFRIAVYENDTPFMCAKKIAAIYRSTR